MKTAIVLVAAVLLIGALQLTRSGYSVDEEFTVFAVRGIQQHGLPLLPSGLLYDRGIAYSYAAWLAGAISGSELPAFRAISLIAAAASVFLTFILVRRVAHGPAALAASVFVALSIPFWATATSARFYAPFLAAYLLTLICFTHRHWWFLLIAAAAIARLTHELAFTLAAIPLVCLLIDRHDRRRWLLATLAVVSGLVIGQLVLFGFHYAAPTSGDTMVRRFFLWQVLNLFERPGDRQFAIPLVVMVIGLIAAPRRAWMISVVALSIAAAVFAFALAQATNSAPFSGELVKRVAIDGSRYPLDMFWHIASQLPLVLGVALIAMGYRASKTEWPPLHRAAHALWIGWVLWFGVIESGITTNYLLLPVTFMVIAIAVDSAALIPRARVPALAAVAVIVLFDQWGGSPIERLEAARPSIRVDGIDEIRNGLQPGDRIACTDELGCLMLVGRIDRWLALDDFVRERFLVQRADGPPTGVYTGVPAAFRPGDLFGPFDSSDVKRSLAQGRPLEADTLPDRVLVIDIFKEHPIGNSRSWLPKAIVEDGLRVTPLLETPQMRVLQISPQEQVAFFQPSP